MESYSIHLYIIYLVYIYYILYICIYYIYVDVYFKYTYIVYIFLCLSVFFHYAQCFYDPFMFVACSFTLFLFSAQYYSIVWVYYNQFIHMDIWFFSGFGCLKQLFLSLPYVLIFLELIPRSEIVGTEDRYFFPLRETI